MSKVHRTSISIQEGLYKAALHRMTEMHHGNFSNYVESLIREDALRNKENGAETDQPALVDTRETYKARGKRTG